MRRGCGSGPQGGCGSEGLSKECVVIGSVDFLEIWDLESWNKYQEETEAAFSAADDDDILSGLL